MKLFFRRIHLYLGLVSGLFMVLVCLTGTILVFEDELEHAFHAERYTVAPAGARLSLTQLTAAVRSARPKAKIASFKVYADPARSVEIGLAGAGRPGEGDGPGGPRGGRGPGTTRGGKPALQAGASGPARGPRGQQEGTSQAEGKPGGPGGKGGKGGGGGPRLYVNPYTGALLGEVNPRE